MIPWHIWRFVLPNNNVQFDTTLRRVLDFASMVVMSLLEGGRRWPTGRARPEASSPSFWHGYCEVVLSIKDMWGHLFTQTVCDRNQDSTAAVWTLCLSMAALNHAVTEGPGSFKHSASHQKFKSVIKKKNAYWPCCKEMRHCSQVSSGGGSFSRSHTFHPPRQFIHCVVEDWCLTSIYRSVFTTHQGNRAPQRTSYRSQHTPNQPGNSHTNNSSASVASAAPRDVSVCVCVRRTKAAPQRWGVEWGGTLAAKMEVPPPLEPTANRTTGWLRVSCSTFPLNIKVDSLASHPLWRYQSWLKSHWIHLHVCEREKELSEKMHDRTDQRDAQGCGCSVDLIAVYFVTLYSGALLRLWSASRDALRLPLGDAHPSLGFSKGPLRVTFQRLFIPFFLYYELKVCPPV